MSTETYEYYEYIIEQLKKSMKALDAIKQETPVEEHIKAAYKELEEAQDLAKKLQRTAQYEDEQN